MGKIQERLALFLLKENLTTQAFERKCNMGVGGASKLTSKSYPKTFVKIAEAFPLLNIDWLKTGEGEMLKPQASDSASASFRVIGEIKEGGKATQGDNSPIYESGKIEESVVVLDSLPADLEGSHKEIRRLMRKLEEKEKEYAKLEGKYEELDRLFRDVLQAKT